MEPGTTHVAAAEPTVASPRSGPVRAAAIKVALAVRLSAAAVGGGLLGLAFPSTDVWLAAPVALGLLCFVLTGARARLGFGLGLTAGLAFFVPTLQWSGIYVGTLPWFALATLEALFLALAGSAYSWLSRTGRVRPVAFALVWVVTEGLRGRAPYGGFPWLKVAFSQADSPFGRLAAIGGTPFVGFVVSLTGGLLALAASRWWRARTTTPARTGPPLQGTLRTGGLAILLGTLGLAMPLPTDGPLANFVAVQGNVPRAGLDFNAERRAVLDNHVAATLRAGQDVTAGRTPAPDLVIWPENSSDIDATRNPDARDLIRSTVETLDTPLIVGGLLEEPVDRISNASLLYQPGQGLAGKYVKRHPVPFGEYIPNRSFWRLFSAQVDLVRRDFVAGTGPGLFTVPTAAGSTIRAGLAICFEVAYDDIMREAVGAGANVLVVQTNNATFGFTAESSQQLAISRLRAMEFGRSIVHVSTVGQSALITPDGSAHQVTSLFTQAVLRGQLPLRDTPTIAARLGDAPEWAAGAGVAMLLGTRVRQARRPPRSTRRSPADTVSGRAPSGSRTTGPLRS